jgi:hypothetical protein
MAGFSLAKGDGHRPSMLVTSDYATEEVGDEAFWAVPRAMAAAPQLQEALDAALAELERLSGSSVPVNEGLVSSLRDTAAIAKAYPLSFIDRHDERVFEALLLGNLVWSLSRPGVWVSTQRDDVAGTIVEKDGKFIASTLFAFTEPCKPMVEPVPFDTLDEAKQATTDAIASHIKAKYPNRSATTVTG